jgi:hypothetical protein
MGVRELNGVLRSTSGFNRVTLRVLEIQHGFQPGFQSFAEAGGEGVLTATHTTAAAAVTPSSVPQSGAAARTASVLPGAT